MPTGGAGELPPDPSVGLRPCGVASRWWAVPAQSALAVAAPQNIGDLGAVMRNSRGPPGRLELCPLQTHCVEGLWAPRGAPGLEATFQGHATRLGTVEGPRAVPGRAVRLLASLGQGRPAARRLKGDSYLHSLGGSAFSPSPYGYFLWTCSALLSSLSELSHIKNHLTYNKGSKDDRV